MTTINDDTRLKRVGHAIVDALLDSPLRPWIVGNGSPGEAACQEAIEKMARAAIEAADAPADAPPRGQPIPRWLTDL